MNTFVVSLGVLFAGINKILRAANAGWRKGSFDLRELPLVRTEAKDGRVLCHLRWPVETLNPQPLAGEVVDILPVFDTGKHCHHCGWIRKRNWVMTMRVYKTGELVDTGSTCVKEYLVDDPAVEAIIKLGRLGMALTREIEEEPVQEELEAEILANLAIELFGPVNMGYRLKPLYRKYGYNWKERDKRLFEGGRDTDWWCYGGDRVRYKVEPHNVWFNKKEAMDRLNKAPRIKEKLKHLIYRSPCYYTTVERWLRDTWRLTQSWGRRCKSADFPVLGAEIAAAICAQ